MKSKYDKVCGKCVLCEPNVDSNVDGFLLFLRLNNTPFAHRYIYHIFFTRSFVAVHFSCFNAMAVVNDAGTNTGSYNLLSS